jgi:pheromone shutdown protein TraB
MNRELSSSSLVMVGTVHRDPKGFGRLLRILEREGPDFITVEISSYAREFRRKRSSDLRLILMENLKKIQGEEREKYRHLLFHGEIQGIFLLLKVPFEWGASEVYAERRQIELRAIDLSAYAEEKLMHISELIDLENLRALLRSPQTPIDDQVNLQYKRARMLWNHPPATGSTILEEVQEREAHMAGEIRRLMEENKKRKILHVGGWEHLMETLHGKSLFTRLGDLKPRRLLLADNI